MSACHSCNTNINYGTEVRTTERFVADADPQKNILESPTDSVLGYYFYLLYFHYLWLSRWYIDETKAATWIEKYDIRQGMTLEHGKTYCGRITDRIADVVKDADADLWSKSAVRRAIHRDSCISDVYARVSCAVSYATHCSYSFSLHRQSNEEIRS